jgi:hypothetical protein
MLERLTFVAATLAPVLPLVVGHVRGL